jgi:hypothetical protein
MKLIQTVVAIALLASPLALSAVEPAPLTVAVFDFESKDEGMRDLGPKVAALVTANLSGQPNLTLVERAELDKVLGEQELGLSGTVSPGSAARIGHLTGAQILVTGRVFKVEKETYVVAKVIGTETSRVHGETVKGASPVSAGDLAVMLSEKVVAALEKKGPEFVAKVLPRAERVAALKKSIRPGKLPSVRVKLPERHFGGPVVDPAAETELGLLLQECGFTLVAGDSTTAADIDVTGEAFSALGMRKGNLTSCKARVEIQAKSKDGSVVAVDRQTSVTADITEQTAAKTALQEAAFDLAERLLPKLAM